MKSINNQAGFTLIELVIGMAILTIIMAAILGVMPASFNAQQYNFEEGANIQDIRVVLNGISDELCNATEVSSPAPGGSANAISYQQDGDDGYRTITLGTTGSDKGYVLFTAPGSADRKLGSGRITSINFNHNHVPAGSSEPCKREITIRVQVQAKTGAPLSELTTSVVTLNAF